MSALRAVLVVDDDKDIREAVGELLQDEGYPVALARHGGEAMAYLADHEPPGLILLDLSMPVMDGIAFREQQRSHAALASIPVVVFSASSPLQEKLEPLQPDGALAKPVDLDQLLKTVTHFCGAAPR